MVFVHPPLPCLLRSSPFRVLLRVCPVDWGALFPDTYIGTSRERVAGLCRRYCTFESFLTIFQ